MINRILPLLCRLVLVQPLTVFAAFTATYDSGNSATDWTVPAGVQSIDVQVTGAGGGGSSYSNSRGGHGAIVAVTIPTTPGETLTIGVGSGGQGGTPGGGGGGMSYIKRGTEYLVIAGGGGGGAYGGFAPKYLPIDGGDGAAGGTPAGGNGGNAYSCSVKDENGNCTSETSTWTLVEDTGGKGGNGTLAPGAGGVGGLDSQCRTPAPGCSNGTAGTAYNGGNGSAGTVPDNPATSGGQGATGTAGGTKFANTYTGSGGGGAGAGGGGGGAWINPHDGGGGAGGSYVIASLTGATFQPANNGGPRLINSGTSNGGSGSVQIVINEPDAPTNVQADRGNGQVTVSWTAPADNGATITAYTVTASTGEQCTTGSGVAPTTTCIVSGLTNGSSYTFTVVATNEGGDSAASAASDAVVPATVPAAPTNVAAAEGAAQLSLSWTAPADGGSAITVYESSSDAGGSWTSLGTTGTSATITGLTNGTAYTLIIRAVNAVGDGTQSASVTATPAAVPAAPTGLGATAGDQQIALSWTAPDDGGSAITDYEYSSDAGSSWTSLSTTGTSATITGLTNFTEYTVIIRAKNARGAGAASSSATATPNEGPLPKADGSFMSTDFSALSGEFLLNQNGSTQSGEKEFAAGEYIEIVAATNPETDIALRLDAPPVGGQPSAANVSEIGIMTYEAGEQGRAQGRGFKPGTEAAVYLFSDPLFLGNTTVQADGTWIRVFDVPADIELGAHTIQAQGVLPNGDMKAATAGVRVARTANPASAEPAVPVPAMPGLFWLLILLLGGLGSRAGLLRIR